MLHSYISLWLACCQSSSPTPARHLKNQHHCENRTGSLFHFRSVDTQSKSFSFVLLLSQQSLRFGRHQPNNFHIEHFFVSHSVAFFIREISVPNIAMERTGRNMGAYRRYMNKHCRLCLNEVKRDELVNCAAKKEIIDLVEQLYNVEVIDSCRCRYRWLGDGIECSRNGSFRRIRK